MKIKITTILLCGYLAAFSQNGAPANPYYNGFDWNQSGNTLRDALATKITTTHTNLLEYFETENALQIVDRVPNDVLNVFLVYGFSNDVCTYVNESNYGSFANWIEHRKRHREADQPAAVSPNQPITECVWNREHVYALSLGTPDLVTSAPGPGTDAHQVRTADVDRNALRASRKFTSGSGNSGVVGSNWYPGDEWKGDVARMMMYMYLRYPTQCKPTGVGTGSVVSTDANMLQLFLQWNAEDPVSQYEDNRNTYLGNASNTYGQGNRNPFIDNPYLATKIWGGTVAQNRWPAVYLGTNSFDYENSVSIYPNPAINESINISSSVAWDEIKIYNVNGQLAKSIQKPNFVDNELQINNLNKGFYFAIFLNDTVSITKKLIIK